MADYHPKLGDRVSIIITGTVVKDSPRFPAGAVLVRVDQGGDTNWFSPASMTKVGEVPALPEGDE
jgi:hypothetical protein